MDREQKAGKEYAKHISMELTADSARVTNLSLDGSRLVLTIEAELAGSQLRSTDPASRESAPRPESESPRQPTSSDAPSLGLATPAEDAVPGSMNLGSENLPPAPAASFTSETISEPESGSKTVADSEKPAVGPAMFMQNASLETVDSPAKTAEPVKRIITPTDIQDASLDNDGLGIVQPPHLPTTPDPVLPPPLPVQESSIVSPEPWQAPELASEDSTKDVTHLSDSQRIIPVSPIADPLLDDQLAVSEESSTIGGVRHGEPQPAISFGQDAPENPILPSISKIEPKDLLKSEPEDAKEAKAPESAKASSDAGQKETTGSTSEQKTQDKTDGEMSSGSESLAPKPDQGKLVDTPAGGGTTVLIRYTCPKCKTQGMQAVDKVGTVVNCSNCGKAMRLVMKK